MHLTSIFIMIITILSKVFGLIREKVLAHFYGTGPLAESFITAFAIPMFLSILITTAIATGFIPLYSQIHGNKGKEEADQFTSNLINISFVVALALTILGLIFTQPLVKIFASGFEGETLRLTIKFTRLGLLTLSIIAVASVIRSYLQYYEKFGVSVSQGLVMNMIIIVFMILASRGKPNLLGYGIFFAMAGQYIIYMPSMIRLDYKHKMNWELKDPAVKEFVYLMIPILMAVSVNELNMIINRSIASMITAGGLAAVNYAYRLQTFVTGIVVTSITTVIYPSLSKSASHRKWNELNETILSSTMIMSLLVIPGAIGLALFAKPIVYLLFFGGEFDMTAVNMTSEVLVFYSIGIIGFGIREIAVRVCYAVKDMKTPVINAIIMVVLNFILNIILGKVMGIKGLSLGATISSIVGAGLLMRSINKKIVKIKWSTIVGEMIKVTVATAIMGVGALFSYQFMTPMFGTNKSLLMAIVVAGVIYFLALVILRVKEMNVLLKKIKRGER